MAKNITRQVGFEYSDRGISDRVHNKTTIPRSSKSNTVARKRSVTRVSIGRNSKVATKEGSVSNLPSVRRKRVLVNFFSHAKEVGRMAPNSEFKTIKQVHKTQTFPNGDSQHGFQITYDRNVGHLDRSERCIFAYPNSSIASSVAPFQGQQPGLCISMPTIRSVDSSTCFHSCSESRGRLPTSQRCTNASIFGRHDSGSKHLSTGKKSHRIRVENIQGSRFYNKYRKISVCSNSVPSFSRGKTRPYKRSGDPDTRESKQHYTVCDHSKTCTVGPSTCMVESAGADGKSSRFSTMVSPTHATYTVTPSLLLQSNSSFHPQDGSNVNHNTKRTGMVAVLSEFDSRNSVPSSISSPGADHGCFQGGMGGSYTAASGEREVVTRGITGSHKPAGVVGCIQDTAGVGGFGYEQASVGEIRQLNSGELHQQTRRDEIPNSLFTHQEVDVLVHRQEGLPYSSTHSRSDQLSCRQSVAGDLTQSNRVVSCEAGSTDDLHKDMATNHRPLCVSEESPITNLLLSDVGSQSSGSGCSVHELGGDGGLRVPASLSHTQGASESTEGGLHNYTNSSVLATAALVSDSSPVISGSSSPSTFRPRSSPDAGIQGSFPRPRASRINSMDLIQQRFEAEGLSAESAKLAAKGRRPSTLQIYSSRLQRYYDWCDERQIDPSTATIGAIADFLRSRFELGLEASTVRGYKTAIQSIHTGCPDGSVVRDSKTLQFLIEGMNISRPRKRKIMPSWDLPTVLKYLNGTPFEPCQSSSLRDLTIKTVFLLAMASGRRCSELHALAIDDHIVFSRSGATLHFRPGFLSKNERCDFVSSPLFIPYLCPSFTAVSRHERLGCPVRALRWYLDKTRIVRGKTKQLFVTSCKPYKAAAKATIAGWLVEAIKKSGAVKGGKSPNAHSTRAISSSWAFSHGLTVNEIVNTVSWRTPTTFITTYLKDLGPCSSQAKYARTVLQASGHTN